MCKTLCGSPDPCAADPATCCRWTWKLALKVGDDCTEEPTECWTVWDAQEVGGRVCQCWFLGFAIPCDCCENNDSVCADLL